MDYKLLTKIATYGEHYEKNPPVNNHKYLCAWQNENSQVIKQKSQPTNKEK